jgi:hypothetical protein
MNSGLGSLASREEKPVLMQDANDTVLPQEIWADKWRKNIMRKQLFIFFALF